MLKKIAACTLIVSASMTYTDSITIQYTHTPSYSKQWGTANTLATGAITGAITGALSNCMENNGVWWPISWLASAKLRDLIVKTIIQNARNNGEYVNPELLDYTSVISSWVSYFGLNRLEYELSSSSPVVVHHHIHV